MARKCYAVLIKQELPIGYWRKNPKYDKMIADGINFQLLSFESDSMRNRCQRSARKKYGDSGQEGNMFKLERIWFNKKALEVTLFVDRLSQFEELLSEKNAC